MKYWYGMELTGNYLFSLDLLAVFRRDNDRIKPGFAGKAGQTVDVDCQ